MNSLAHWTEYSRFIITLVAVLDPFIAIPIFLGLAANREAKERHRLARLTTFTVFIVLVVAALSGEAILRIIGASLASFRIGGGIVLLLMALAMLNMRVRRANEETINIEDEDNVGVVPLAVPLLAGPGAISAVIIAAEGGNWAHKLAILFCILSVCVLLWLILRLSVKIGKAFGTIGINIANRLIGLLLASFAIEIIGIGLKQMFPILGGGG